MASGVLGLPAPECELFGIQSSLKCCLLCLLLSGDSLMIFMSFGANCVLQWLQAGSQEHSSRIQARACSMGPRSGQLSREISLWKKEERGMMSFHENVSKGKMNVIPKIR